MSLAPRPVVPHHVGVSPSPSRSTRRASPISRPHISNDHPYSAAQLKTLNYRPDFPERLDSLEHARAHAADFFPWYNTVHRHGGRGLHTPHDGHDGLAPS